VGRGGESGGRGGGEGRFKRDIEPFSAENHAPPDGKSEGINCPGDPEGGQILGVAAQPPREFRWDEGPTGDRADKKTSTATLGGRRSRAPHDCYHTGSAMAP